MPTKKLYSRKKDYESASIARLLRNLAGYGIYPLV